MGVWACSAGSLRFGARLSQEVLNTLVPKLANDENRHLERQDEGMFCAVFTDEEHDEGAMSLEDLNNQLNYWLKMQHVQRQLLVMSAGVADRGSPLRLLAPELLKTIFLSLMPVKAPSLQSLLDDSAKLTKVADAETKLAEPADTPAEAMEDDPYAPPSDKAIAHCIRSFGAEPVDELEAMPVWQRQRSRYSQLHSLYRTRYPLELQIDFVTKFEAYDQEFPFYILGVTGEQDAPSFSGEKKLGWGDGECSGVDFCAPIGNFSPPSGAKEKITAAIDTLRAGGMLPAEKTEKEIAEIEESGRIIMPNIPYVAEVGWNVVGHSHVG